MRLFLIFSFLAIFASGCTMSESPSNTNTDSAAFSKLYRYYQQGNYFKLRDGLNNLQKKDKPGIRFLSAVAYHAFNKPAKSNQIIGQLIETKSSLADTLLGKIHQLKMKNHLRLFQYSEALAAAQSIIEAPTGQVDSVITTNAENMARLFKVLAEVPPQEVAKRTATSLQMTRDKAGLQRIPVQIEGEQRRFVLDTGAGLSVIMRSTAKELGLDIKKVPDFTAKAATGGKVQANVAIADKVVLGNIEYHHVVFMVFPDRALSFPQIKYNIPGIIGFPVIEAAGEVQFLKNNVLEIPATIPSSDMHNLALKGLSPRVLLSIEIIDSGKVALQADSLMCTLDTGAMRTPVLAPFYRRYSSQIKKVGRRDTVGIGGAGGVEKIPVYLLPQMQFHIGAATATLKQVQVYTETTFEDRGSSLACNIGQDILGQFDTTIINFKSMSFMLE